MRLLIVAGVGAVLVAGNPGMRAERHREKAAEPDVQLTGDHLEQTVHCHNNALHVVGSGSRLTVEGRCTTVWVEGSKNFIEVQDADVIDTRGDRNMVLYLTPGTRTVDRGRANSVTAKWQQ